MIEIYINSKIGEKTASSAKLCCGFFAYVRQWIKKTPLLIHKHCTYRNDQVFSHCFGECCWLIRESHSSRALVFPRNGIITYFRFRTRSESTFVILNFLFSALTSNNRMVLQILHLCKWGYVLCSSV